MKKVYLVLVVLVMVVLGAGRVAADNGAAGPGVAGDTVARVRSAQPMAGTLRVWPMPAVGQVQATIHLNRTAKVSLSVMSLLGQRVLAGQAMVLDAGEHRLSIGLGDLAPGIYLLECQADRQRQTMKIVVSR